MKKLVLNQYHNNNYFYQIIMFRDKRYFKKKLISDDQKYLQSLNNEKKILSILKQYSTFPQIASFNEERHEIIYKYIEGTKLSHVGRVNVAQALNLIVKIIEVLQILHSNEIVHCDIKPDNIIINENKIYLLDFGISQYKDENIFLGYGSYRYCSPEQYNKQKLDNRTDIYSLGIILYELITDNQIFDDKSYSFIVKNKLIGNLPKISENIINIPIEIDDIFSKATEVNKENRYENIDLMKRDIRNVLNKYYKE